MPTLAGSVDTDEMPHNALFAKKKATFRERNTSFLFGFIICYNDPFQVYCIKPEGRIHSDNKGAECDYFWRLAITHFLGQLAGYLFHNSCDIICALFSYPPSGAIIGLELAIDPLPPPPPPKGEF